MLLFLWSAYSLPMCGSEFSEKNLHDQAIQKLLWETSGRGCRKLVHASPCHHSDVSVPPHLADSRCCDFLAANSACFGRQRDFQRDGQTNRGGYKRGGGCKSCNKDGGIVHRLIAWRLQLRGGGGARSGFFSEYEYDESSRAAGDKSRVNSYLQVGVPFNQCETVLFLTSYAYCLADMLFLATNTVVRRQSRGGSDGEAVAEKQDGG
jgi:hypothetical protein